MHLSKRRTSLTAFLAVLLTVETIASPVSFAAVDTLRSLSTQENRAGAEELTRKLTTATVNPSAAGLEENDLNLISEQELRQRMGPLMPEPVISAFLEARRQAPFQSLTDLTSRVSGIGGGMKKAFQRVGLSVKKPKATVTFPGVPTDVVASIRAQMRTPAQQENATQFLLELSKIAPIINWEQSRAELPTLALQVVRDRFMGVLYTVKVTPAERKPWLAYDGRTEPSQTGWPRVLEQSVNRDDPELDIQLQALLDEVSVIPDQWTPENRIDISRAIQLAQVVNPEFITLVSQENHTQTEAEDFRRFIEELHWQVFIPGGWLLEEVISVEGVKYPGIKRFRNNPWERDTHLGAVEIWKGRADSVVTDSDAALAGGLSRQELTWLDPGVIERFQQVLIGDMDSDTNNIFPALSRLKEIRSRVGLQRLAANVFRAYTEREEQKHAEDNVVLAKKLGWNLRMEPRSVFFKAEFLPAPGSFIQRLYGLDSIPEAGRIWDDVQNWAGSILEFSAKLGATIALMENLHRQGEDELAYAAFAMYLWRAQKYLGGDIGSAERGASLYLIRSLFDSNWVTSDQGRDYVSPEATPLLNNQFANQAIQALLVKTVEQNNPTYKDKTEKALRVLKSIYTQNLIVHGPGMMVNAAGLEETVEEQVRLDSTARLALVDQVKAYLRDLSRAGITIQVLDPEVIRQYPALAVLSEISDSVLVDRGEETLGILRDRNASWVDYYGLAVNADRFNEKASGITVMIHEPGDESFVQFLTGLLHAMAPLKLASQTETEHLAAQLLQLAA